MNIIKRQAWEPFDLMTDFQNEVNRLFHRSLHKKNGWEKTFEPEVDVLDEKDGFVIKADLPGVKKDDIEVKVEGRVVTLKGERKEEKETREKSSFTSERFYGTFTRMLELPADVKAEQVKAVYKDGVLEITLPKTEGARTNRVAVEVK